MTASVSQYVLKVCSRCDLSCDHCYVYEHADQSWRHKPKVMDGATAWQVARRISEHADRHHLGEVHVILHGGEPLLLGADGLREILQVLRSSIEQVTRLDLRIHTNGILLNERLCSLFADYDVKVGVSLDGDRAANDRHRRFSDGRSSHSLVRRALAWLRKPEYRYLYAGILCTIDLENDPVAVYDALLAEAPPRLDFLLPHATWNRPPPRPPGVGAPYAEWLGKIHERWLADGRPVPIRVFDSILAAWEGGRSESEAVGLDPVDLLVIDTDGSWEQADSLKTAFDGAPATGLNVFSHSVDEATTHPGVAIRRAGISALCATCQSCSLVRVCGGGLYAHRYRSGTGFDNPSVYCDDLKVLIPRITKMPPVTPTAPVNEIHVPPSHFLPAGAFDLLAAGPGDASAMALLADSRWSVNRALLAAVASRLNGKGSALGRAAAEGWEFLSTLEADQPEVVREVLTYPYVQAWAIQCLAPAASVDPELDHAHLAGLAASAAWRAGIEAEFTVPVRAGSVYLPMTGALLLNDISARTVVIRVSSTGLTPGSERYEWQAVRWVTADGMSLTVEDVDPFRDCRAWLATRRLPDARWQAWQLALPAAIRQLAVQVPGYASVIRAGLRSVVPMRSGSAANLQSGTSRRAFGAIALAFPDNVDTLSALLLHEMQHVKLTALCDLFDLFDRADRRLFQVPWKAEPRPIEGVLHGTYAHLALADLWRARSRNAHDGEARRKFFMYRSWVVQVIEKLSDAGIGTPHGDRFVDGMRKTAEGWGDD